MNLLLRFIIFFRVTRSQSPVDIVGYAGKAVTLPSGANTSQTLQDIEWSILANNTFIATYHSGTSITNWFHQYSSRLHLNVETGDLSINNLKFEDALVYKVELRQKRNNYKREIKLDIREPLPSPTIEVVASALIDKERWLILKCSSLDKGIAFTWEVQHLAFSTLNCNSNDKCSAAYNITQNPVQFTCITRDGASAVYQDDVLWEEPAPVKCCRISAIIYPVVFISGCLVTSIFIHCKVKYNQNNLETATAS